MKRLIAAGLAGTLMAGCSVVHHHRPHTPTIGERIPVLNTESNPTVDPALAATAVTIPPPQVNTDWAQRGGNAAKDIGHVALGEHLTEAWSANAGLGSGPRARLGSGPVLANGRIYTIDTRAVVHAFDANTGALVWEREVRGERASAETLFGGGLAFDNGRIYATNGSGYAAALDANTGTIAWIVRPGGPLRGAPTVASDTVYVITQDNQIFALNTSNGENRWTASASFELAGIFGAAAPAFAQSTVVAGYSSGELTAYRYENGEVVWQDALARTGVTTTVGTLSDIDADPVVDNGRVFAVGQGGRMVAIELVTGQRAWEINIAGIATPVAAGDWVFVVTDRARLLCVSRANGHIRWIAQLQQYRNEEHHNGPLTWRGPVLAGNHLVLVSSLGQIAFVSPADGTITSTIDHRVPISLAPIVANNTLYILDDAGKLTAWR